MTSSWITACVRMSRGPVARFLLDRSTTILVAVAVFWIAYENGGYGLSARTIPAIAAWWAIILGIGLSVWPRLRVPRAATIAGGLLAGFAALALASTAWAASAEEAFTEFNRVSLYLALYLLAVLGCNRENVSRVCDGLALGIVATAFVSLASRLFPDVFSLRGLPEFLPSAATRLAFPVGYWNGLAILTALAFPLCFRAALAAPGPIRSALPVAPLPALSAVLYLTSSRGGVAVAAVALAVFLAAARQWSALWVLTATAVGSALAVLVLLDRHELVDGPLRSAAARSQGNSAALLLAGCCVLTAVLQALGRLAGERLPRPSRTFGRLVFGFCVAVVVAGLLAAHPVRRFHEFKKPPGQAADISSRDFVRAHLLSGTGSGRWQFWKAAVDEFRSKPLAGRGAGSYEAWWARHGSFSYFVRNAHSLFLEALGELGIIGFALIGGFVVWSIAVGTGRLGQNVEQRLTVAALVGACAGFAVGAAVDWVWQLTAVGGVGIICFGLLTGSATAGRPRPGLVPRGGTRPRTSFAVGVAALVVAWILICAQAIPWFAEIRIADSQAAVRRGDGHAALADALDAKRLQPWAASPYLQLALVNEQLGEIRAAVRWISKAIDRDDEDWRLWLVSARLETKAGKIAAARRDLTQAAALNPRSPVFRGLKGP